MNSQQRFTATVSGAPIDRRVVAPLLSLYGASLIDCPLETYYSDGDCYIAGQAAVYEKFAPDLLFGPFCLAKEGLPFGSQVAYYPALPPNQIKPVAFAELDVAAFSVAQLLQHPVVSYQEQAIAGLMARFGTALPIVPILLSPLDLPVMIIGIEAWLQKLLFESDSIDELLNLSSAYFVARCNRLFDFGVPAVVIATTFANPSILTRSLVESLAKPILNRAFAECRGPLLIHSSGAPLEPFLDVLGGLPRVAGFILNPGENMQRARKKLAKQKVLAGNLDGGNLHRMTAEAIFHSSCELLESNRQDRHLILATSGADIRPETPAENIHALFKAAQQVRG